ncbi:uncharacterized protein LOC119734685 [Patiria miniata]|uniref:TIR domain-containing protein n=1 Tax=Patiria miniata TaxID=46514 RepID=A0A914AK84_PATMI|nr:uncharacterized protein LOC119734685 [Patiria miniata]
MSSFLVVDRLIVDTQSTGQCCIELCQGDITQLDVKDKVDVLCVSVFGSSYSPSSHTLVGALNKKLNLSVKRLAKDKEEDLRHAYMCWWSKPLPENLPFRKLLCFENRGRLFRPQELVANVFRCLVPILNNEPGTVISPLLNTGGQGRDEATMLVGMVEAAIKWMKAGLPLKQLKIVLYANVIKGKVITVHMRDQEGIMKAFRDLKKKHNRQIFIPMAVPLEYDIYLSHSAADGQIASMVETKFRASKPDIRIYKSEEVPVENAEDKAETEGSFWQEDLFKIMSRCARVVPILSPAFLESKACVDLYNMALCCNRRAQRDLLAPLYIEKIEDMPTYMGLVQYIDCSPKDEAKISEGCEHLVQSLAHSSMKVHTEMVIADTSPLHYDVFVSYSHQDSRLAAPIVEKLQKMNPELRIFFDIQELKAGTAWQKMLYHAIDGCRSFMALVSNSYMKSAMCIEEFNLALAKHCSSDSRLCLVPVCIEPLVDPLPEFQQVKLINATPDVFDPAVEIICNSLVDWIAGRDWSPLLDSIFRKKMRKTVDASEYAMERRRLEFTLKYGKGEKILKRDDVTYPPSLQGVYSPSPLADDTNTNDKPCDVAFSCSPEDKKFVNYMTKILRKVSPGLVIKETADTENERLALMESARKVVVFLSANYLESVQQVEEFHTVLLRQRYRSPTQVLFPIILHNLPQLPTYFHLVPCEFNLFDPMWMDLYTKYLIIKDLRKMDQVHLSHELERSESIAVIAATHSLLGQLKTESELPPAAKTSQEPMLLNVMLLSSEVSRLHKKVRNVDEVDADKFGNVSNEGNADAGSLEDFLLNIVELPLATEDLATGASDAGISSVSDLESTSPDTQARDGDEAVSIHEFTQTPQTAMSSTEAKSKNGNNSNDRYFPDKNPDITVNSKEQSMNESHTKNGEMEDISPIDEPLVGLDGQPQVNNAGKNEDQSQQDFQSRVEPSSESATNIGSSMPIKHTDDVSVKPASASEQGPPNEGSNTTHLSAPSSSRGNEKDGLDAVSSQEEADDGTPVDGPYVLHQKTQSPSLGAQSAESTPVPSTSWCNTL